MGVDDWKTFCATEDLYTLNILEYSNFVGSIYYVANILFSNFDTTGFKFGGPTFNTQEAQLYIIFYGTCFMMIIHLLNMLIAIMGQSFDKNAEIADSNRKISQLEFVVNNWWIHPIKNT